MAEEESFVYDGGETRVHQEHADEAYRMVRAADAVAVQGRHEAERRLQDRAQWHATMAVYELLAASTLGT